MSKGQTLRALVKERLALAAEDIFVLFERTIAEYEEELCRSKEENQRKQQLLEQLHRASVQENVPIPSWSPGPGLKQEILESGQMKEEPKEQSFKQLPVPVPESSGVCVKTEEASLPTQRLCEHREETQDRSDISSETETETGQPELNDEHWEPPFSCPAAQMETEHYSQVHSTDTSSKLSPQAFCTAQSSVHRADADQGRKHQCPFCFKICVTNQRLQLHIRVHTGEKPFSCSFCKKSFAQKGGLDLHTRTHTGEKPFSCSSCSKCFADPSALRRHRRIHIGEKPLSNLGASYT